MPSTIANSGRDAHVAATAFGRRRDPIRGWCGYADCMHDSMAGNDRQRDGQAMRPSSRFGLPGREPDNELYDRGCDLVGAAAAIRRAAASPQAVRGIPAVLGCVEAALEELLWAVAELEVTTADEVDRRSHGRGDPRSDRSRDRMHVGYANLERCLSDAERAASAARALAHRALYTDRESG